MVLVSLVVSLLVPGLGPPVVDSPRYTMLDLGPGRPGREAGLRCNCSGWLLADSWNGPGWFWRPGVGWRQLPTYPGYRHTEARAINDTGMVACYLNNGGINAAGVWDLQHGVSKVEMPDTLTFSQTHDINGLGWIVGSGQDSEGLGHGFLSLAGRAAIDLGRVEGLSANAHSVTLTGSIFGNHASRTTPYTLHRWIKGELLSVLGHPDSGGVFVESANNLGDVVVQQGTIGVPEDVRWADGTWADLGNAPGEGEGWTAEWINDDRWIVGYGASVGLRRAILWRPKIGAVWVDQLVDSSTDGYRIEAVYCVTNNGFMCGSAVKPGDTRTRPILLVPYPLKSAFGG